MVRIALCGFSGSGKDTIANIFVSKYCFNKLSFGSAIKDVLSSIFGWDRKMLEGVTQEDRIKREIPDLWWSQELGISNFSPRMAMQKIGTDLFRDKFNENIWIKVVERKLMDYENIVITDCRFPNEIKMLKSNGFLVINVERIKPNWFDSYTHGNYSEEANKLHESEKSWIREKFDYTIINTSSIEQLKFAIAFLYLVLK